SCVRQCTLKHRSDSAADNCHDQARCRKVGVSTNSAERYAVDSGEQERNATGKSSNGNSANDSSSHNTDNRENCSQDADTDEHLLAADLTHHPDHAKSHNKEEDKRELQSPARRFMGSTESVLNVKWNERPNTGLCSDIKELSNNTNAVVAVAPQATEHAFS